MPRSAVLVYLLAAVSGTYLAHRPVFDSGFAVVRAETGDGMLNHYLLEHSWRAVADPGYVGRLHRPPFFYPDRWAYWYSETLVGAAPLYWALRAGGLSDELAYPWWMVAGSVLNFVSFALVARRLGCAHPAAALGAFVWAFLAVLVDQEKHQQLIPRFWMPPAVYYGWLAATAPTVRAVNRSLACVFLQAVTCVYTGWFLVVGLAVFVPLAAMAGPGFRPLLAFVRAHWKGAALAVGGWGLALAAFFAPYLIANPDQRRSYYECLYLIPTPAGWLTPAPGTAWAGPASLVVPEVNYECRLFPGVGVAWVGVTAALWAWDRRRRPGRPPAWPFVAACLGTAAVWAVLSTRVGGTSGWWFVQFVPGSGAIRCVSRACFLVYLFGALAGAAWLTAAVARLRSPGLRAAAWAALAAVIAYEQAGVAPPLLGRDSFYPVLDPYADALRGAEVGYVAPRWKRPQEYEDVFGMWVGLRANVPVVNGYSGRHPDHYPLVEMPDADTALRAWLRGKFRGRVAVVERGDPGARREVVVE